MLKNTKIRKNIYKNASLGRFDRKKMTLFFPKRHFLLVFNPKTRFQNPVFEKHVFFYFSFVVNGRVVCFHFF
jgi:hypothetical protein